MFRALRCLRRTALGGRRVGGGVRVGRRVRVGGRVEGVLRVGRGVRRVGRGVRKLGGSLEAESRVDGAGGGRLQKKKGRRI